VKKSDIEIEKGLTSQFKRIEINLSEEDLRKIILTFL